MRVEIEDEGHLSRFAKLGLSSTSFLLNAHTHRMFPEKNMLLNIWLNIILNAHVH